MTEEKVYPYEYMSKEDMITCDRQGNFPTAGVLCTSFYSAIVLLTFNEDTVGGYYQYMENPKEYFMVKLYYNAKRDSYYFRLRNRRYYLDEFLRTNI